jgi:hypothetical protein
MDELPSIQNRIGAIMGVGSFKPNEPIFPVNIATTVTKTWSC